MLAGISKYLIQQSIGIYTVHTVGGGGGRLYIYIYVYIYICGYVYICQLINFMIYHIIEYKHIKLATNY